MSSDADAAAAATIELYDSFYTGRYCDVAAAVVFIFDAFITFDRDVACFWNTKWTGASLLFFANKWISMLFYVIAFVELASFHSDKFVPGAVLALSLAPVGANLLRSWAALRDMRSSKRLSLSDILFHGGMSLAVTCPPKRLLVPDSVDRNHIFYVAGDGGGGYSLITAFTSPISAILISRFLLALQEASQAVVRLDRDDPLHSSRNPWDSTPSFISSLGGFINPDLSTRSNDDGFEMELQVPSPPEAGEEEEGWAQAEFQPAPDPGRGMYPRL
ncbi:hypothetical protein C8T65DRAFT_758654 [Cerioporus squamosus]|nr:hypothetical protein C8T65DRAFT_758654 [Cerioporus squamosus]